MDKLVRTHQEWRRRLTSEQYEVTRRKGTERPFSGAYHTEKAPAVYHCVCCDQELFDSGDKYDSGTGWPSFKGPVRDESVCTESDKSLRMIRTEVLCSQCNAHLGHVFDDGPAPRGMRYCINSVALRIKLK